MKRGTQRDSNPCFFPRIRSSIPPLPPSLSFFLTGKIFSQNIPVGNDRKEYYKITIGPVRSIRVSSFTIKLEYTVGTPTKVDTWKFNFPAATKNTDRRVESADRPSDSTRV